jgi:hypothetical protein
MGGTSPEGAGADRTSGPIAGWQRVRGVDAQAQRFDPCAFLIGIPMDTKYLENVRGHLATLATRESAILRDALDRSGTLSARDEARLAEIREERTLSEANLGKMLKDTEREQRAREIAIPASTFGRRENGSYAERRSFLRDLAAASTGDTHAADLIRSHDDLRRTELQDEGRSILTSTGIGSFTPRIVAPGEAFPGTGSPFWDWLGPMQLPEGGEVRLPRFTEAFVGGVQTAEGTALAASTPTVSDAVGVVRTFGAATTLTYQSLELSRQISITPFSRGLAVRTRPRSRTPRSTDPVPARSRARRHTAPLTLPTSSTSPEPLPQRGRSSSRRWPRRRAPLSMPCTRRTWPSSCTRVGSAGSLR